MDINQQLSELRSKWKLANGVDRKIIEARAKLLTYAQDKINSAKVETQNTVELAKDIFLK
jgi:hypothetical protein